METIDKPQQDLPNAATVLTLGILSLVFSWCFGIVGLILGIIALVLASQQRKLYLNNPTVYTENSYGNVNSGRIFSIIAICVSVIVVIIWLCSCN